MKKATVIKSLVVLAAIVGLWFAIWSAWTSRLKPGYLEPQQYEEVRSFFGAFGAFLPPAIPPHAKGIRIFSPGYGDRMPQPDHNLEVRFVVSPSEAAAIEADAAKRSILVNFTYESLLQNLRTADDENGSTALPPGFNSFLLVNPSGTNIGGVTVNSTTGEVIYWIFES